MRTEKERNIFKKAGVAKTEKKKRKDYYTNKEKLKLNYKKLRNINKPSYMQEHAKNAENMNIKVTVNMNMLTSMDLPA